MTDRMGPPGRLDYFIRRETQERLLASRAGDCAARHAHLAMANRYAALVRDDERLVVITTPAAA